MYHCNNIMCHVWCFGSNTQRADPSICPACGVQGKPLTTSAVLSIRTIVSQD